MADIAAAVWQVLPARMPGHDHVVVANHLPGTDPVQVTQALEAMVVSGRVIRRHRYGRDVYYRGLPPPVEGDSRCLPKQDSVQPALFPEL